MKIFKRCFLCFQTEYKLSGIVCENCIYKLDKLKFYSCIRCGLKNCLGCQRLIEFKKIFTLYTYSNGIPEVLLLAKEKNDTFYIKLFKDLFYAECKNFLENLLFIHKYNYILLPVLKQERILNSSWHPANLFFEIFTEIFEKSDFMDNNIVLLPSQFTSRLFKQSLIPQKNRENSYKKFELKNVYFDQNLIKNYDIKNSNKILILDDVLTSGQTALMMQKSFLNYFPRAEWHFFSLFRSPQKID
ncbi:hypothetical protein QEJ31_09285 [Pigmentibacter sp. JX0631]|uniref:hypothetical protein n=1 Tax=Pigmentibacter sp. JX0631 TaxID=2976982 RepID=UPI002469B4F8|nr:hypothetical protein [Pigmentibacter sp. JX0631]WGL58721.1 hypothetical protein QEJ31_09285 [Pigmentibacter sp. JX0631]